MIRLIIDQTLAPPDEKLSDEQIHSTEVAINTHVKNVRGMIDIRLVDDQEIQRLNRMYRNKDSVTDVLSFAYEATEFLSQHEDLPPSANQLLGDVAVSLPQAKRQMQGTDLELELMDLIVHGVLHVLGFDHETSADAKEMFPLQDNVIKTVLKEQSL